MFAIHLNSIRVNRPHFGQSACLSSTGVVFDPQLSQVPISLCPGGDVLLIVFLPFLQEVDDFVEFGARFV